MPLWQLLGLLGLGAVGLGTLAASNARTTGGPSTLSAADTNLLNRAVQSAIATEADIKTLQEFASKLRAANYASYADAIDYKLKQLGRITETKLGRGIQFIFAKSSS